MTSLGISILMLNYPSCEQGLHNLQPEFPLLQFKIIASKSCPLQPERMISLLIYFHNRYQRLSNPHLPNPKTPLLLIHHILINYVS